MHPALATLMVVALVFVGTYMAAPAAELSSVESGGGEDRWLSPATTATPMVQTDDPDPGGAAPAASPDLDPASLAGLYAPPGAVPRAAVDPPPSS